MQFPFDEVAEKIVRALERRNWKVPGINVEFDIYGSGEAKYQKVNYISGENFRLYFSRIQGCINGRWNDTAALYSVCIPKQIINVFDDESGPVYYLYVGKNWDSDKKWFMNSVKVHSKLNKEPRRYLQYCGTTYNKRAQYLAANNDLGREYLPISSEPIWINLEQKFQEFTAWLEEYVLKYILNFPEDKVIRLNIPIEEPISYTGPWSTVYSICSSRDAERIKKGKEDPSELPLEDRHAYIGNGRRLVPLDVICKDRFPKIAYEGFIWCDVYQKQEISGKSKLVREVMNAMESSFGGNYIATINLKYANQVYVADNSKYVETRQQLFETIAPRDRLTDEELGNAFAARVATIVPITEYKGSYKEPIVLINRELEFEEIEQIIPIEK